MNRIALFTLLLLLPGALFSQDKLAKLTYSIIDTSTSQTAQVEAIYTWITNNIEYDLKQFQKGSGKHFTPEQTVRRRKAVHSGYAELLNEMCRRVGIESYVVNGYSKGFGYLKGEGFLKADHAWNVCRADTLWIIVDAAWGSGNFDYDYTFWSKLRTALLGKPKIRTKLIYVPNPTDDYFAMKPIIAAETHFPLDSKWQLLPEAVPYGTFVFDSTLAPIAVDFVDKTYITRMKSAGYNLFLDGISSVKYNPNNRFDIGHEYYREAANISKAVANNLDVSNLPLLDTTISYYSQSIGFMQDFRTRRRDGYSAKRLSQSQIYRNASQCFRGMRRIPTTPNGYYASADKRYMRVERALDKAMSSAKEGANTYRFGVQYTFDAPNKPDTAGFASLRIINADCFTTYTFHSSILENKLPALIDIHSGDTLLNEQLIPHLDSTTSRLLTIDQMVDNMDVFLFFRHCDTLSQIYARYDTLLSRKGNVSASLAKSLSEFNLSFTMAEGALKRILRNYERMAKKSGQNEYYSSLATVVADRLHQLYQHQLLAVAVSARSNKSWHHLADLQDNELAIFGGQGVVDIGNRAAMFYAHVYANNARKYKNDITQADNIKNSSRANLSVAKKQQRALKKIQQASRKKRVRINL